MKMNIFNKRLTSCFRHATASSMLWVLASLLFAQVSVGVSRVYAQSGNYEYVMKVNRSAMAVVDDKVVVSLQLTAIQDVPAMQSVVLMPELIDTTTLRKLELPLIFVNSRNQQIYFERELVDEYPDALALRKKNGEDLVIDYVRTVKHDPWMDNAVLKLHKMSCACNDRVSRGEMIVAAFDNKKEEVAPEINLFPVYLLPPADNSVKVREEKGSAYLCFVVDRSEIKPDYMNNPVELQKIHSSVNLVKNDSDVTIRKMTIDGYASPEGTNKHNLQLSIDRTNSLRRYLERTGMTKGIRMEASGRGENWVGFLKYLRENYDVPQRSRLLSIAESSLDPDEKERRMRKETPEGYAYVLKNVFPSLRCTNYNVIYTVRPFTIEESERVFETRPINLNLNEIYRLAGKYANDQEKYNAIMRKAYMLYPNDSYINLTMSCLAIKRGDVDEAAECLKKVNDCREKTMNEGLVAYMRGDVERAIRLVEQARAQGLAEATQQLEEFAKLKIK